MSELNPYASPTVSHFTTLLLCIGFTCGYHELVKIQAVAPNRDFDS